MLGTGSTVYAFGSEDLDIADREQVLHIMQTIKPQAVVNCAAYTAVDACERERDKCWRVNAHGPGILAAACAESNARLVHISTDYVFDGKKPLPHPYTEMDQVAPLSQYGSSKLAGEENIRDRLANHLILRTAWLYGIGGRNFLKTMLRLAVTDPGRTIRVVNDQFGALTWTYRLALQIKVLLGAELTGTIHATAEGYCSWYEGARQFLEAMRVPFSLEPCSTAEYPTPASRPANSILENTVLRTHGLNRMAAWQDDVAAFAGQYYNELLTEARL